MSIDQFFPAVWNRTSTAKRWACLNVLLFGFLIHLFAFTNIIPNSDGLSRIYDVQDMTVSGRWFLHYATMPGGFMQMPVFIGGLTLIFLAISALLMVDILGIKSPTMGGLLGLILVATPCLGYTFLYLFTASAYAIGILLAVLSVWVARRGQWQLLAVGALILSLSMGIYQAYAPLAIGLCVLLIMREILSPRSTLRSTAILGVKYMAFLATGAVLYYAILQITLMVTGQSLLPYLGMDNVESGYPLAQLPALIFAAYKQVIAFFVVPTITATTTLPMALGNAVAIGLTLVSVWRIATDFTANRKDHWRIPALLAMGAILPLAVGFGQIISPFSVPTPLMQFPYLVIYGAMLLLMERALPSMRRERLCGGLLVASLLLVCIGGSWVSNLLYTASAQAHRASESYATRLYTRVESAEGYLSGMPVLIIGAFPTDTYYADIPGYQAIDHYSAPRDTVLTLNKHIYYYLNDWLNIPVAEPAEDVMISMSNSAAFQSMPLYPSDGSVAVVDGQLVVKIAPAYTPKSPYEIAYENRK